ncbi:hypothetical protein B0H13DRAFT_137169 [Mycena leptocephala]|nr:hypothetical protein B0H13DRAFT_137169 [Mycena leptocephala]
MFDRALSRFFNGWMGSRDEFVWDFYREFRDEEYEDDMLQRRWLPKAVKGIQGFAVSEYELNEGITAEQFMRGLNLDREKETFEWIDLDARHPPRLLRFRPSKHHLFQSSKRPRTRLSSRRRYVSRSPIRERIRRSRFLRSLASILLRRHR